MRQRTAGGNAVVTLVQMMRRVAPGLAEDITAHLVGILRCTRPGTQFLYSPGHCPAGCVGHPSNVSHLGYSQQKEKWPLVSSRDRAWVALDCQGKHRRLKRGTPACGARGRILPPNLRRQWLESQGVPSPAHIVGLPGVMSTSTLCSMNVQANHATQEFQWTWSFSSRLKRPP
jgi:hypothetical protein